MATFMGVPLVKSHISASFQDWVLKWYTLEFDDIERGGINKDPGQGTWIMTFSLRFNMSISIAFGFLTDKAYSLKNACCYQLPA